MQIGTVFNYEGNQFTIKDVDMSERGPSGKIGRVDASLLKAGKDGVVRPQRGRPRMFDYDTVAKILGISPDDDTGATISTPSDSIPDSVHLEIQEPLNEEVIRRIKSVMSQPDDSFDSF